jgi:hypothetical protein
MPGATRFTPYKRTAKKSEEAVEKQMVVAQIKSPEGDILGPPLNLPADATPQQLQLLVDSLLQSVFTCVIDIQMIICRMSQRRMRFLWKRRRL